MAQNLDAAAPVGHCGEWRTQFCNLPLVLSYKANIKPVFRDYTSGLIYDLSVYQSLFDRFDAEASAAPPEQAGALWEAMLAAEGRKFIDFFNQTLAELDSQVRGFSETEHQHHGFYFRRQVWNIILHIPFLTQTHPGEDWHGRQERNFKTSDPTRRSRLSPPPGSPILRSEK